jgi:murein DD-endopeptidase MepM/ murein hydrolase activator NlpD
VAARTNTRTAFARLLASAAGLLFCGTGVALAGTDCSDCELGDRTLAHGDSGRDVSIVNHILRSKWYAADVPLERDFGDLTEGGVREFQQRKSLIVTGIVDHTVARALRHSITQYKATWYGPGFWGRRTACGQTLTRDTHGVAHRTLPCGTRVLLSKNGRSVKTRVIDRGPFVRGITWDLTKATAEKLGFSQSSILRAAVPRNQSGSASSSGSGSTGTSGSSCGGGSASAQPNFKVARRDARPAVDYPDDGIKPEYTYKITGVSQPVDAKVKVIDESAGRTIRSYCLQDVPPDTSRTLEWDNRTSSGEMAPKGKYQFKLTRPDGSIPNSTSTASPNHHFQWRGHLFPLRASHYYGDGWGAGRGHKGTDVFGYCGAPIKAARSGTVIAKQYQGSGAGYYIVIYSSDTNRSYVYMHMQGSTFNNFGISTGSHVATRQQIGTEGQSGNASGCHLHFELWKGQWFNGGYAYDSEPTLRKWDTWS